jgi:hypothetical protein
MLISFCERKDVGKYGCFVDFFSYKIDHITAENKYRFSLNVSVCLETSDDCYLSFPVMTEVDIPVLDCDFNNVSYAIKGLQDYKMFFIQCHVQIQINTGNHGNEIQKVMEVYYMEFYNFVEANFHGLLAFQFCLD